MTTLDKAIAKLKNNENLTYEEAAYIVAAVSELLPGGTSFNFAHLDDTTEALLVAHNKKGEAHAS
jgi:hypothetical protein